MRGAFPCRLWRSPRLAEIEHALFAARRSVLTQSEYDFLLGRFIDRATVARASAIARQWGVHPHEVMIANGWLEAEDYYARWPNDAPRRSKTGWPPPMSSPPARG